MPLTKPGFPPQVSEVFEPLRNETTFLHANLEVVKELFGKQESIQILHEVAPGAFTLIRHAFRHEIIMALSRITDPKTTGKGKNAKENLTIKQLIHVIAQNCTDTAFITRLEGLEKDIETACAPFRDLRNRSIGHLDLKTILQLHPDPLPFVDLKLIENTLNRDFPIRIGFVVLVEKVRRVLREVRAADRIVVLLGAIIGHVVEQNLTR